MVNKKICAIIVTYNRKSLLLECLAAIAQQSLPVDSIYIIDNFSTDGTLNTLINNGFIEKLEEINEGECEIRSTYLVRNQGFVNKLNVIYIRLAENIGGAGGFSRGLMKAFESKFDWYWLMDDDAEPDTTCLKKLMDWSHLSELLCPRVLGLEGYQDYHHKLMNVLDFSESPIQINGASDILSINANAFVGPLISKQLIEQIGYPIAEYFIWGDDTEYTYRANEFCKPLLILGAIIKHKDNLYFSRAKGRGLDLVWKKYYGYRNNVYSVLKHGRSFKKYILILKLAKRSLIDALDIYVKFNSVAGYICPLGVIHGIFGKLGKYIDPVDFNKNFHK